MQCSSNKGLKKRNIKDIKAYNIDFKKGSFWTIVSFYLFIYLFSRIHWFLSPDNMFIESTLSYTLCNYIMMNPHKAYLTAVTNVGLLTYLAYFTSRQSAILVQMEGFQMHGKHMVLQFGFELRFAICIYPGLKFYFEVP